MSYHIGVDIGGTFTDAIVLDDKQGIVVGKASSTPPDFEQGFMASVGSAAERLGMSLEELLGQTDQVFHGTTVGTNALVERRTATVGLLTTRGAEDSIFVMRAGGRHWNAPPEEIARTPAHSKPDPLVPKPLVRGIDERITHDGQVLVDLNADTARQAIRELLEAGAEAIAISLLWSTVNPSHERLLAEMVAEEAPEAFVTLSSDVVRRPGEYERTVATVVNGLIGPVMKSYLSRLEAGLKDHDYAGELYIMSCAGGVVSSEHAQRLPVLTIGSGPTAGVIASGELNKRRPEEEDSEAPDVLTADMGGTTFDVGVIRRGEPLTRRTTWYDRYEYFIPTVDVRSIGAGAGSIVRYDPALGALRVGPQSAGAKPGPVAYGQGGTEPTVADAGLVLGYLNVDGFLGGTMKLDIDAAARALERVGQKLGYGADETAAAAARIVDNQMVDAIRLASVQQGYDPRQHTMYAYGGAGPVHATAVAQELGIPQVVIPLREVAAGWSAFGTVSADALVVEELPTVMKYPFDAAALTELFSEAETTVRKSLVDQGLGTDGIACDFMADLRYTAQVNTIRVPLSRGRYEREEDLQKILHTFESEYARLFGPGSGFSEAGYVLTAVCARAVVPRGPAGAVGVQAENGGDPRIGARSVIFYEDSLERQEVPVYDGLVVNPGFSADGPALIDFPETTVVVRPGQSAYVDRTGSLVVPMGTAR